ncbi:TPA: helix-turn-helix domain-containing protein [Pasteurella multocida]|nr:helix-turn-helix domain-containing protein [Pasteurella multocida]
MSSKLLGHVWDLDLPDHATKLVLLRLADSANDETGECWPSLKHIQDKCNIKSKNTIRRALEVLEQLGLLVVIKRKLSAKQNTSNLYRLNIKKILEPSSVSIKLGGGSNSELGGSNSELGGSNSELGGGSNSEPRTNNSFEPINELNTPLPPKGESANADGERNVKEDLSPKNKKNRSAEKIDYQGVIDAFNEANTENGSKLPFVRELSDKRKTSIKKFLLSLKEPTAKCAGNYFSALFSMLRPFHFGEEKNSTWKANFDWAIRGETVIKVREENL